MTQRPRDSVPSGSMLAFQTQAGQTKQIHPQTFDDHFFFFFFDSTGMILLPVTFAYSLSSEAVVMRQLRR